MDDLNLKLDTLPPFLDFQEAADAVLKYLKGRFGFSLWMITRVQKDDWIILQSNDEYYNTHSGNVLRWSDSVCSRMIKGKGPTIAPVLKSIPEYAKAPIVQQIPIEAYIGYPLMNQDGELFGTLCAIDPAPQPKKITKDHKLLEMIAQLLSTMLHLEIKQHRLREELEQMEQKSMLDPLTGIFNRGAWDEIIKSEEERCKRLGGPITAILIDLNDLKKVNDSEGHDAGDELIKKAANALVTTARASDFYARLGGDEFGMLLIETNADAAKHMLNRLKANFELFGVNAAIGHAERDPRKSLADAIKQADDHMYAVKGRKRKRETS